MKWLLIALPLILAALYVLSLRGRVGHPERKKGLEAFDIDD